jgi:hypothetical protein
MTRDMPILLVEDNPMDVDLTLRAFRSHKVPNPVNVARDGEEALDWLPRWAGGSAPRPVLVLLDLKLPRVDGLEVLRQIKQHPTLRTLPVVVLTTSSEQTDIDAAYLLGANSYIVKPVAFEQFMQVIQQTSQYWTAVNQPAG